MLTREINGVTFEVESPSFYRLPGLPVDVSFLGDSWYLQCPGEDGEPRYRAFPTVDAAACMIALAWGNARLC